MPDLARDLLDFINASPTPYHAVAEAARRLEAHGYRRLDEGQPWTVAAGDRRYVVRNDGSIVAFERGSDDPAEAGFRVVGAHTDSPNLRIKPKADLVAFGARRLAAEPYGGVLLHTWLDRDLSLAGRVVVRQPDAAPRTLLVDLKRSLLSVPNLAIHLQREILTDGLKLDRQEHMVPLLGLESAPPLATMLAEHLHEVHDTAVEPSDILSFELMAYDVQPAALGGADEALIHAARLDNLASCHAGLSAVLAGGDTAAPPFTRVVALWDHEEVGSASAHGAGGPMLRDVLRRLSASGEALRRSMPRSLLISADMAHAVHPSRPTRHEPGHQPRLGGGPVIKSNVSQRYASDAPTMAAFVAFCEEAGEPYQQYVHRSDQPCGSTIGSIVASGVGIPTVDVGNPMLAMHSCRELAAAADVPAMISVLRAFFGTLSNPG